MATVSSLVRSSNGRMSFIDYTNTYRDNNKEFLRGDLWEFRFINPPKIVYYPGDDLINARLNQVNVGIDSSVMGFDKQMRGGWSIHQSTSQRMSGTLTLGFVDREDQAITYFATDWRNKIADPETMYSFRKDDVVADAQLIITNSGRIDVRVLNFYNLSLTDAPLDENGAPEAGTDRSDIQMSFQFEHYSREFKNL